ncbi:hypothetical protein NIES4101_49260 [Calothrix sp. NIES-4101]|nr:hypothetical protein NIES4101_49260 [Calothrix sp. NIES-4101]
MTLYVGQDDLVEKINKNRVRHQVDLNNFSKPVAEKCQPLNDLALIIERYLHTKAS